LRSELKDKERETHSLETRCAYDKQEVVKQLHEVQLKSEFIMEKLSTKESECLFKQNEIEKTRQENLSLKACIKEADKNREVLARQMTQAVQQ